MSSSSEAQRYAGIARGHINTLLRDLEECKALEGRSVEPAYKRIIAAQLDKRLFVSVNAAITAIQKADEELRK